MKRITVHSFRGGTGKSLVALNLALNLAKQKEKKVLIIESDVNMPSFIEILNIEPKFTFNDYYESKCELSKTITPTSYEFDAVCCSYDFSLTDEIFSIDQAYHSKKLKQYLSDLRSISPQYDYCIIDSSPGWGFIQINNGLIANKIILVLRAELTNFKGTIKMVQDIYRKTFALGKKFAVFWNQIPKIREMKSIIHDWENQFASEMKIEQHLYLNYHDEIAYNIARGNHVINDVSAFDDIIDQLCNFCEK